MKPDVWRYQLRLIGNGLFWGSWVSAGIALGLIAAVPWMAKQWPDGELLLNVASGALPLGTIMLYASLAGDEVEGRMLAHLLTLPGALRRLLLVRLALGAAMQTGMTLILLAACAAADRSFAASGLAAAFPLLWLSNLLLGLLVLAAVLIGRQASAGLIAGGVYWLAELVLAEWSGPLRLVWRSAPEAADAIRVLVVALPGILLALSLLVYMATRGKERILRRG